MKVKNILFLIFFFSFVHSAMKETVLPKFKISNFNQLVDAVQKEKEERLSARTSSRNSQESSPSYSPGKPSCVKNPENNNNK